MTTDEKSFELTEPYDVGAIARRAVRDGTDRA